MNLLLKSLIHRIEEVAKAISKHTRVLYMESPVNPTMRLVDLAAIARLALQKLSGKGRHPQGVVDAAPVRAEVLLHGLLDCDDALFHAIISHKSVPRRLAGKKETIF